MSVVPVSSKRVAKAAPTIASTKKSRSPNWASWPCAFARSVSVCVRFAELATHRGKLRASHCCFLDAVLDGMDSGYSPRRRSSCLLRGCLRSAQFDVSAPVLGGRRWVHTAQGCAPLRAHDAHEIVVTLAVFSAAAVVALRYPIGGMAMICLCLLVYLSPGAPDVQR